MSHDFTGSVPGVDAIFSTGDKETQIMAVPADVDWNAPVAATGIIYTAPGVFTLPAGHIYKLDSTLIPTAGSSGTEWQWQDIGGTPLGNLYLGQNNTEHIHVTAAVTGTGQQVKLRLVTVISSVTVDANSTYTITSLN